MGWLCSGGLGFGRTHHGGARLTQLARCEVFRQGGAWRKRVQRVLVGVVFLADPGQGVQGQTVAHGRVTGNQVQALIAYKPRATDPGRIGKCVAFVGGNRQHIANDGVELLLEHAAQAQALEFVIEPGVKGVDVDRQAALAPEVIPGVFVARHDEVAVQAQLVGEVLHKALCVHRRVMRGM